MNDLNRQEVDAKIAVVEANVETRIANHETFIKTGFAELRLEMAEFRLEMAGLRLEMAGLRVEMHKNTVSIIKWVIGTMFAFSALTIGTVIHVVDSALEQHIHSVPAAAPAQPARGARDPEHVRPEPATATSSSGR